MTMVYICTIIWKTRQNSMKAEMGICDEINEEKITHARIARMILVADSCAGYVRIGLSRKSDDGWRTDPWSHQMADGKKFPPCPNQVIEKLGGLLQPRLRHLVHVIQEAIIIIISTTLSLFYALYPSSVCFLLSGLYENLHLLAILLLLRRMYRV